MKNKSTIIFVIVALFALVASLSFLWIQFRSVRSLVQANATQTDRVIATLEKSVAATPDKPQLAVALSDAYLQKIRETGDATLYKKIEDVLNVAAAKSPDNADIVAKRAAVANGRHQFKDGLVEIHKAITRSPQTAYMYGIESDSEIELGQYDAAEQSLQKMLNLKPAFSAYARVAYQRELHGDFDGALSALADAISAGSSNVENMAWAYTETGKLRIRTDRVKAKLDFEHALAIQPAYAPALESLGRLSYADGNMVAAEKFYRDAFVAFPTAQFAQSLANFYVARGEKEKADQQAALADIAFKDAKGVNVDLEYALFLADHGDPKVALARAQSAYAGRPSIYGADVLAWALFKNGRAHEALKYVGESLRLGETDTTILFHAASIYETLGETVRARELFTKAKSIDQFTFPNYSAALKER